MKFSSEKRSDQVLAMALIILGTLFRVVPHADNVTPTTAIALFSGVTLPPALALTVPILVMMASDLVLGLHSLFWLVWATFAAVVGIGLWVRKDARAARITGGTLSGSILFFVVTNLGVFFFENMYPKTWPGLVQCFTMAVPFFRNSLIGDVLYSFVFFALFAAAQWSHHLFQSSKNF